MSGSQNENKIPTAVAAIPNCKNFERNCKRSQPIGDFEEDTFPGEISLCHAPKRQNKRSKPLDLEEDGDMSIRTVLDFEREDSDEDHEGINDRVSQMEQVATNSFNKPLKNETKTSFMVSFDSLGATSTESEFREALGSINKKSEETEQKTPKTLQKIENLVSLFKKM